VSTRAPADTRDRILDAACDVIAEHGIEDVRIARIATLAGVSPALVHYHFETREALLAEALEHSFELLGNVRTLADGGEHWSALRKLAWMVDQSLPFPGMGEREWNLWLELWRRAARTRDLQPIAAQLYARYDAWIAEAVQEAVDNGELPACDVRAVTQRLIARIDGLGLRVLVDDPEMPLARARELALGGLAEELGIGVAAFGPEGGSR
jgi:AcrR family transcriptional regulator